MLRARAGRETGKRSMIASSRRTTDWPWCVSDESQSNKLSPGVDKLPIMEVLYESMMERCGGFLEWRAWDPGGGVGKRVVASQHLSVLRPSRRSAGSIGRALDPAGQQYGALAVESRGESCRAWEGRLPVYEGANRQGQDLPGENPAGR